MIVLTRDVEASITLASNIDFLVLETERLDEVLPESGKLFCDFLLIGRSRSATF